MAVEVLLLETGGTDNLLIEAGGDVLLESSDLPNPPRFHSSPGTGRSKTNAGTGRTFTNPGTDRSP